MAFRTETNTGGCTRPSTNKVTIRKKAHRTMVDALRDAISTVEYGVVLVQVKDIGLMPYVRSTVERAVIHQDSIADLPFPKIRSLKALHAWDSRRDADLAKRLRGDEVGLQLSSLLLEDCPTLNCLSSEGATLLLEHLESNGCVTVQQTYRSILREHIVSSLGALENRAKAQHGLILLFVQCSPTDDVAWMTDHVTEFISAEECEPGPGAEIAFCLASQSLYNQHGCGIGRSMYEIAIGNGFKHKRSVFIAANARDRFMWLMRRDGASLSEIAELLGIDKSTVSKRLKSLLPNTLNLQVDLRVGWRKEWFSVAGVDIESEEEIDDMPRSREL